MTRFIGILICFLEPITSAAVANLKDATGTPVSTPATAETAPKRIITLAPSLAELASSLLETDLERIVGVAEETDEPAALLKRPTVGPFHRPNLERIVALKPDLVLATRDGNPRSEIERLRKMGIPVYVASSRNLAEVRESIYEVARVMGQETRGSTLVGQLDRAVELIRKRASLRAAKTPGQTRRVLLQVGVDPIVVSGKGTFLNEALEILGVKNAFGDAKNAYPRPSWEELVRRNPDQVLILLMGIPKERAEKAFRLWERFPQLKAVREKRVNAVRSDALLRPAVRYAEGLLALERAIFGSGRASP